jgi:hypothetical protein
VKRAELLQADVLSEVVLLGSAVAILLSLLLVLVVAASATAGFPLA